MIRSLSDAVFILAAVVIGCFCWVALFTLARGAGQTVLAVLQSIGQ